MANGGPACLKKYSGIYLSRDKNQVAQLILYSSDGTFLSLDSDQKTGSPTIESRNDRTGTWKCRDSKVPDILTQSLQVEESIRADKPVVARLYETETTCSNNKRQNCSDIIQYRGLNVTIIRDPPQQVYSFAENFYSFDARSRFLHYKGYATHRRQHRQCLREKSGLHVIEYEKKSSDGGVKKTYGLFLLKDDGFFTLINSDERENGTHKFGTTLGRWRCTSNHLFATGNYFIYHPKQKLGEVQFRIRRCSSPMTQACTGYVESRQYPLQLRQRPFTNGTSKSTERITMKQYLSEAQRNNESCYKHFAGIYFMQLGGVNQTNGTIQLNGDYRIIQFYSDGLIFGSGVAEILTSQSAGNLVGNWKCNRINASTTHIQSVRVIFAYDTNGGPNLRIVITNKMCDNKLKSCVGQSITKVYDSQLPDQGQFQNPAYTLSLGSNLYFYANFPPY